MYLTENHSPPIRWGWGSEGQGGSFCLCGEEFSWLFIIQPPLEAVDVNAAQLPPHHV